MNYCIACDEEPDTAHIWLMSSIQLMMWKICFWGFHFDVTLLLLLGAYTELMNALESDLCYFCTREH